MLEVLQFVLRPLIQFLELGGDGENIYQYLYFTRSGVEKRVEAALQGRHNIIIVGNPGSGKTTLMHYMFINFKKENIYYPIILDFRNISPRTPKAILTKFCNEIKEYFKVINNPISEITESTTLSNCEDQALIIQQHLANKCLLKDIEKKKLIIFLDDLDYAENDYITILNDYFLPYMHTDKVCVILSVRPTLYNSIQTFDPLRQHYHIFPREIILPEDDLEYIIHNRLKGIIKQKEIQHENESMLEKFLRVFKKQSYDDIILSLIKKINPEFEALNFTLPFDETFYAKLRDITFFNIRIVEEILPHFIEYQLGSNSNDIHENFYDVFLEQNFQKQHIIPDLVSKKTSSNKTIHHNNSILQIVLEYFYFEKVVNERFYEKMKQYGIDKVSAENSIITLTNTPFSMLTPEFIYEKNLLNNTEVIKTYNINIKGIKFIENILIHEKYYELKKLTKSNRSLYKELK